MLSVAMKLREGSFAEKSASSALASTISVITFILHNFYNLWGFVVFEIEIMFKCKISIPSPRKVNGNFRGE